MQNNYLPHAFHSKFDHANHYESRKSFVIE